MYFKVSSGVKGSFVLTGLKKNKTALSRGKIVLIESEELFAPDVKAAINDGLLIPVTTPESVKNEISEVLVTNISTGFVEIGGVKVSPGSSVFLEGEQANDEKLSSLEKKGVVTIMQNKMTPSQIKNKYDLKGVVKANKIDTNNYEDGGESEDNQDLKEALAISNMNDYLEKIKEAEELSEGKEEAPLTWDPTEAKVKKAQKIEVTKGTIPAEGYEPEEDSENGPIVDKNRKASIATGKVPKSAKEKKIVETSNIPNRKKGVSKKKQIRK